VQHQRMTDQPVIDRGIDGATVQHVGQLTTHVTYLTETPAPPASPPHQGAQVDVLPFIQRIRALGSTFTEQLQQQNEEPQLQQQNEDLQQQTVRLQQRNEDEQIELERWAENMGYELHIQRRES
jgi:hypothetical protein